MCKGIAKLVSESKYISNLYEELSRPHKLKEIKDCTSKILESTVPYPPKNSMIIFKEIDILKKLPREVEIEEITGPGSTKFIRIINIEDISLIYDINVHNISQDIYYELPSGMIQSIDIKSDLYINAEFIIELNNINEDEYEQIMDRLSIYIDEFELDREFTYKGVSIESIHSFDYRKRDANES